MRRMLWSMLRVVLATFAVVVVMAILLGRIERETTDLRNPAASRIQPVSGHLFAAWERDLRLLDRETGMLECVKLPDGDHLEHAVSSPWRDGRNRTHVVGLWHGKFRAGTGAPSGVARYAVPGWQVVDRIETDVIPASPPCWFPDMSASVLFTGWDGRLYRFDFEPPAGGSDEGAPGHARPLIWRVPPPTDCVTIADLDWPLDPRFEGKILVTLVFAEKGDPKTVPATIVSRSQLWWLQLSADRLAIVGAGRLIGDAPESQADAPMAERFPVVGSGPQGTLVLAYMAGRGSKQVDRLHLAPLTIGRAGAPRVDRADVVEVARNAIFTAPTFSQDGRWLYSIPHTIPAPTRALRFSVGDLLAAASREAPGTPVRTDRLSASGHEETGE